MKQNKTMTLQRNIKLHTFQHGDSDMDQQEKLNYFPESNRNTSDVRAARRRLRRSSDGGSGGGGGGGEYVRHKDARNLNLKDEVPNIIHQKNVPIRNFYQSPRRNGLSPRIDLIDDDEDDDDDEARLSRGMGGGLQDEYEEQRPLHRRSQLSIKHINRPTYSCSSCGATFHIKSLLGAHRRTHDDDFKVRFRNRHLRESSTAIAGGANANAKQCKFCDRFFDLERALRIHQMCHCNKITPQQRRKLGYTDLAHEKKNTPLPTFQRLPKSQTALDGGADSVPDPNMPYVALGPQAIKMIEQEQQKKAKRPPTKYTVKVAGPMGRWR